MVIIGLDNCIVDCVFIHPTQVHQLRDFAVGDKHVGNAYACYVGMVTVIVHPLGHGRAESTVTHTIFDRYHGTSLAAHFVKQLLIDRLKR